MRATRDEQPNPGASGKAMSDGVEIDANRLRFGGSRCEPGETVAHVRRVSSFVDLTHSDEDVVVRVVRRVHQLDHGVTHDVEVRRERLAGELGHVWPEGEPGVVAI